MASFRCDIDDNVYANDLLTNEDIPSLIKYLNNPKIYANTLKIPFPYTQTEGENFLQIIKTNSKDFVRIFSIRLKSNDELIGLCGFHRSTTNQRVTEIGYWLGEPFWHNGLMVKVVQKLIQIIKTEWKNLVRIEGEMFHWNKPSMRVVEKCGFSLEGILRKKTHKNGQDVDIHLYSFIFE